tara:strand:- start:5 stop:1087 length:1083 start_codon:yes stop_codon:yes gene_type:complete
LIGLVALTTSFSLKVGTWSAANMKNCAVSNAESYFNSGIGRVVNGNPESKFENFFNLIYCNGDGYHNDGKINPNKKSAIIEYINSCVEYDNHGDEACSNYPKGDKIDNIEDSYALCTQELRCSIIKHRAEIINDDGNAPKYPRSFIALMKSYECKRDSDCDGIEGNEIECDDIILDDFEKSLNEFPGLICSFFPNPFLNGLLFFGSSFSSFIDFFLIVDNTRERDIGRDIRSLGLSITLASMLYFSIFKKLLGDENEETNVVNSENFPELTLVEPEYSNVIEKNKAEAQFFLAVSAIASMSSVMFLMITEYSNICSGIMGSIDHGLDVAPVPDVEMSRRNGVIELQPLDQRGQAERSIDA